VSFKIKIDDTNLKQRFNVAKSIAYGTANAINATAKTVQAAEQENVKKKFHVRKPDFILRQAAIIKPFASVNQGRPYAEISVGQKDRLLLSMFERGGERRAFIGANQAVPITGSPARPSADASVPQNMQIKSLNMTPELHASVKAQAKSIKGSTRSETARLRKTFKHASASGQPWQGRDRTYLIPGVGVFQRTGPGKRDSTLLYRFKPVVQLKPTLGFVGIASDTGRRQLARNIELAVMKELVVKWAK